MKHIQISCLIISHNRPRALRRAVRSAKNHPEIKEILVLDNGSDRKMYKIDGTRFFRSDKNLGVAGGRNFLAQQARYPYLFFMDDDALLRQDLKAAIDFMKSHKRAAVLGFNIFNQKGGLIQWHFRRSRKLRNQAFEAINFTGGGNLIKKRVFDELDGFDERFFYSGEEMDFSFRARQKKYQVWHFPGAGVIHKKSSIGLGRSPASKYFFNSRGHILFALKNLPFYQAPFHILFWLIYNLRLLMKYLDLTKN